MESELELMASGQDEKGMTTRIKEAMGALVREIGLVERLEVSADIAKRVWELSQAIDANLRKGRGLDRDIARLVTKRISEGKLD